MSRDMKTWKEFIPPYASQYGYLQLVKEADYEWSDYLDLHIFTKMCPSFKIKVHSLD